MGDIVLSAGVRQNLLALQNSAQLMGVAQNRLATGKKVNSALDNPFNFFTSQSLSNRARDLNALLDSIGQAQQTIAEADHGITAISKLVESAKAIAKQAQQTAQPPTTYALAITGNAAIPADSPAVLTGSVGSLTTGTTLVATLGMSVGDVVTVGDGTNTRSHTVGAGDTVASVITSLNGSGAPWTVAVNGTGNLEVTSSNNSSTLTVSGNGAAALFGGTATAAPTNSTVAGYTGTMTIQVGSTTSTLDFSTITNRTQLAAALGNISGITASINGANQLSITSTSSDTVTIGGTAASNFFAPANIGANAPTATVPTPNSTRATLQAQYNELLVQIDGLAKDSSYNGVNLLTGDNLKVTFNEDGTSFLNLAGVTFTSAGLGLTPTTADEFQTNGGVDAFLGRIDAALATLRAQASSFGSKLGTVQTRQDFTKKMIQTLETGADNLVLADSNEEGANMLALQTRQQLSTTALSLSAQADQAVLRLFG